MNESWKKMICLIPEGIAIVNIHNTEIDYINDEFR